MILVMRYCHVTGGGRIRFQIYRSMGGSLATAFTKTKGTMVRAKKLFAQ